jgi:hypothetical protein
MATQSIIEFVKELLKRAGLVTDGQYDMDYVGQLADEVEKKMGLTIMNQLDEESMLEYAKLVDAGETSDPQVSYNFFKEHIADFENKRLEVLQDFAATFIARTKKMKESL